MQVKSDTFRRVYTTSLIWMVLLVNTLICHAQGGCDDRFKDISQAYNDGEWNKAKNSSIKYINEFDNKDGGSPASYCKDYTPLVYNYLIQSCLRLFEIDSATTYYFHALKNDYSLNLKPDDQRLLRQQATLKKHSINFYIGIISADIRETKFGLAYGLSNNIFIETSYNNRHFNHISEGGDGLFGKPLTKEPGKFPDYNFQIRGYERYIDLAAYYKYPVLVSQKDVNLFYISGGVFMTYYLNTHAHSWRLFRTDSSSGPVAEMNQPYHGNRRITRMKAWDIDMDLKRIYKDQFNYGAFMNLGSSIRLKNLWELFFEVKFAVGKNNQYQYARFSSYKPGVDYFFLDIGITKKFYQTRYKKTPPK